MANNECCDPQPIRGGGGGGGGPIALNGDVTGLSNANIAEQSSRATFPINAVLAGPLATLVLRGGTGDAGLSTNGTDLSLSPGAAGGNADVGSFATVRLRNASQLQAESTVAGTYRALIYLDGTNTIQLGDAAVPLNVRGSAGTCAVPFVWSALQTYTATSGPNNAGQQLGVGTENTGANVTTYWGLAGATAADSAHRGTYVQLRGGTGWPSDNVTAGGIGGVAFLRGGDGGAGGAATAAGDARHAIVRGGDAGADNGGGGGNGGDVQISGGSGSGASKFGGSVTTTGGIGVGAGSAGGNINSVAGAGGVSASAAASGSGGGAFYRGGAGGAGTATAVGGPGGTATFAGGAGGAGSATTASGLGGTATLNAGPPGAAGGGVGAAGSGVNVIASSAVGTGNNSGGNIVVSGGTSSGNRIGGSVAVVGGTGGPTSGSGGTVGLTGGSGAAGTGVLAAGSGGVAQLLGGGAGVAGAAGGGPGGAAQVAGGAGSGTQQGGNAQVNGGTGGSGGGTGGSVAIFGGTGGAAGLAGGAVSVDGGTPGAGGLGGAVTIGTTAAQSVTIGRATKTTTINGSLAMGGAAAASALVTLISTTQGALTAPVMTTAQRNAIAAPATGLQTYVSTTQRPSFYDSAAWQFAAIEPTGATVTTNENAFPNPGYGDLATVGPAVTVTLGAAATVVVVFSAIVYNATGAGFTGYVSIEASGATVIAASDNNGVFCASPGGSFTVPMSRTLTLALNAGTTTLTLKYKRDNAGQDWHALNRSLSVHP